MESPMERSKSTILIVDDHPLFRLGVTHFLSPQADAFELLEARSQQEAHHAIREHSIDLAIVDICLPDGSGLELIRNHRSKHPRLKWLVFSVFDESFHKMRARRAGAHGYLSKAVAQDQLLEAVLALLAGGEFPAGFVSGGIFRPSKLLSTSDIAMDQLSERELTIFRLIAEGNTVEEIATSLSRSRKTINAIRDRIRAKLKVKSSAELARFATQWHVSMAESKATPPCTQVRLQQIQIFESQIGGFWLHELLSYKTKSGNLLCT